LELQRNGRENSLCRESNSFVGLTIGLQVPNRTKNLLFGVWSKSVNIKFSNVKLLHLFTLPILCTLKDQVEITEYNYIASVST